MGIGGCDGCGGCGAIGNVTNRIAKNGSCGADADCGDSPHQEQSMLNSVVLCLLFSFPPHNFQKSKWSAESTEFTLQIIKLMISITKLQIPSVLLENRTMQKLLFYFSCFFLFLATAHSSAFTWVFLQSMPIHVH
jgi:hypothetical protein